MTYYDYVIRVRCGGGFVDIPIRAVSSGVARNMVEAQYGSGSFMGVISECQCS
jgi:hypothetical protein